MMAKKRFAFHSAQDVLSTLTDALLIQKRYAGANHPEAA